MFKRTIHCVFLKGILLSFASICQAQFVKTNALNIPNLREVTMEWADFDTNGTQDLFLNGIDSLGTVVSQIYYNTSGTSFLEGDEQLSKSWWSFSEVVDFDGDNRIDLILSGKTGDKSIRSTAYRNGGDTLRPFDLELPHQILGATIARDFDNDGDVDIIQQGFGFEQGISLHLYENENGIWQRRGTGEQAGLQVVDYDLADIEGDGDLDLIFSGVDFGGELITELWENQGGLNFDVVKLDFPGISAGSIDFIDFDADGDMDLLQTGSRFGDLTLLLEYDQGTYRRTENTGLDEFHSSGAAIGNFNNDSLPDIVIGGFCGSGCTVKIYANNGNGTFSPIDLKSPVPDIYNVSCSQVDLDADGIDEIFISGTRENQKPLSLLLKYDSNNTEFVY